MPELPEVETIKRDLSRVLSGRKIVSLEVRKPKLFRNSLSFAKSKLIKAEINSVNRRAKLLLLEISTGYVLAIHLKMTGQLVWQSAAGKVKSGGHPIINVNKVPNKFTYITLTFSDRSKLYFNDIRQFGYWQLIERAQIDQHFENYGPEPLTPNFSLSGLIDSMGKHRRAPIKSILLNQQVVAGLGNIYVDESLHIAGVRPTRRGATIKPKEAKKIHEAIKLVLIKAVKARGTSFSTYIDALGKSGNYWHLRLVYGREGERCFKCGNFIKKIKLAGRGTHYCAFCQH